MPYTPLSDPAVRGSMSVPTSQSLPRASPSLAELGIAIYLASLLRKERDPILSSVEEHMAKIQMIAGNATGSTLEKHEVLEKGSQSA